MTQKDIRNLHFEARFILDREVYKMVDLLRNAATTGIEKLTDFANQLTIGKCIKGIYFEKIYKDEDDNGPYVDYVINGDERSCELDEFGADIIVRLAVHCYNTWRSLVENGILEKKNEKRRIK